MATITAPSELHFMQSFDIDPKKQKYETVRSPEEKTLDISSLGWKSDSINFKRFLVYMDENALCFTILQENDVKNDVIFDECIFIDLSEAIPTQFYFELYSESKILSCFFGCVSAISPIPANLPLPLISGVKRRENFCIKKTVKD